MAEQVNIATINIDVNQFIKSASDAKKAIEELNKKNKEMAAAGESTSAAYVQNEIELKNLREEYTQNTRAARNLQTASRDLTAMISTEGKSVQQMTQDRAKLIALSKEIPGNTQEEIDLRNQLNTAIDTQTEAIRANGSNYSASKDGIGEYKQALATLSPELAKVVGTLGAVRDGLIAQKENLMNAISAVKDKMTADKGAAGANGLVSASIITVNGALKLFKLALMSTGIGAIVVALGALITYLTTTQEGIDMVNKVLVPLKQVMAATLGIVQDLGKAIADAFSGKSNKLTEFGEAIKLNIIEKFQAVKKIVVGILTFNGKMISEGSKQYKKSSDDYKKSINEVGAAVKARYAEAIADGKKIAALDIEIQKGKNELILKEGELRNEMKKANAIAEDASKQGAEREAAAVRSIAISNELLGAQQAIVDKEIEKMTLEQKANDTDRKGNAALNELIAKRNELETASIEFQTTQRTKVNSIRAAQETAYQAQKEAGYMRTIEQLNEELNLFLAQQGDKSRTLQEELTIAQEVAARKTEILNVQHDAGKKSEAEYQTELLNINKDVLAKSSEIATKAAFETAEREAEDIERTIINQEEKNARLLEVEKNFQAERLKLGEISELEYNSLINELNEENRIQNEELAAEREAVDKENRLATEQLTFEEKQQREREQLEERKRREIEAAEKIGADVNLINQKYQQLNLDLEQQQLDQKLSLTSQALSGLSSIVGKNSKTAKVAAIAQALINTYQGITAALTLPFPMNIVAAATTGVTGMAAVANIKKTKAARGMLVSGRKHSEGGTMVEAERGESIINANSTSKYKGLLSAINQEGGGIGFGASASTQNSIINYDAMRSAMVSAVSAMPAPQVAVKDIQDVSKKYTKVIERANI